MQLYWKANKQLVTFGIVTFICLLFGSVLFYFNALIYDNWLLIQRISVHQIGYAPAANWVYDSNLFFNQAGNFLANSILLERAKGISGVEARHFFDVIIKPFETNNIFSNTSNLNFDQIRSLISFYQEINVWIQWFTFFAAVSIISGIIAILMWLWNSYREWSDQRSYYFWSYQLIFSTNFLGYCFSIILWNQRNKLSNLWFEKCQQYTPFVWFKTLSNFFGNFENLNSHDELPFIQTKNLSFSYDRGHNFFRHMRDVFYLSILKKEYKEEKHIYRRQKLFKILQKMLPFLKIRTKIILDDINLQIQKGSFTTILGANGSGKSSLIKCLLGLEKYYFGSIFWNNKNMHRINRKSFAKNVSYFPQILDVPAGISVYDFVALGRTPYLNLSSKLTDDDKKIIYESLVETNTLEFVTKKMDELSGGQRQKVIIATILSQRTNTIILDEPTTYLDVKNQHLLLKILQELNQKGKTIITILHDLNQASYYSSELIVLKEGRIYAQGNPKAVINDQMLQSVFGVKTTISLLNEWPVITDVEVCDDKTK